MIAGSLRPPAARVRLPRLLGAAAALIALATTPPSAHAVKPYDLNGDGRQELVLGFPNWTDPGGEEVGAVVAFGSKRRLVGSPHVLTRGELGVPSGDWGAAMGWSIASADFDRDRRADLALGAPTLGEYEQSTYDWRGAVVIAYGARRLPGRTKLFRERKTEIPSFFGQYMVAGDLSRDRFADLVLGPSDFDVMPGGKDGVSRSGAFTIGAPPGGRNHYNVRALAFGDTTRSRPGEIFEASTGRDGGQEPEVPGHLSGVFDGADQASWVAEDMPRGTGPRSIALGDVDGDGYRDLVAGIPHDQPHDYGEPGGPAGAVRIWWGGPKRLSAEPTTITQDSPGVPGTSEPPDSFGFSVAVGQLDADKYADIVVGAPGEDPRPDFEYPLGRVTIIRGGPAGYATTGNRSFGYDTPGVPGSVEGGDSYFGFTMSVLDFNGDGRPDVAIPAGDGVSVFRGSRRGITLKDVRRIEYSDAGVRSYPTAGGNADYVRVGRAGSSG